MDHFFIPLAQFGRMYDNVGDFHSAAISQREMMIGALRMAKKYFVEYQLVHAWTQMTAICSGPIRPLTPSTDNVEYIAITPLFEMGCLPGAAVCCRHVRWADKELDNAAVSSHNSDMREADKPERRKMLTEQSAGIVSIIPHTEPVMSVCG